uniref:Uncharacterized protein n=1 Tax=Triticum urartu TaxID=4572 RepID=A0A8R7UA57_TRIUA
MSRAGGPRLGGDDRVHGKRADLTESMLAWLGRASSASKPDSGSCRFLMGPMIVGVFLFQMKTSRSSCMKSTHAGQEHTYREV